MRWTSTVFVWNASLSAVNNTVLAERYLGAANSAVYLMRPDPCDCALAGVMRTRSAWRPPRLSDSHDHTEHRCQYCKPGRLLREACWPCTRASPADESDAINARLVLILSNHIGDIHVLDAALALAADAAGAHTNPTAASYPIGGTVGMSTDDHSTCFDAGRRHHDDARLYARIRQRFRNRSPAGCLAGGTELAAEMRVWLVWRAALGHGVHRPVASERAHLVLPDPPVGEALQPLSSYRRAVLALGAEHRRGRDLARAVPLGSRCRIREAPLTWITGMRTMTTAGDVNTQVGMASHVYLVNQSMHDDYFFSADSELLVVPQQGRLRFCHRARHHRSRAQGNRDHPARSGVPGRGAGRALSRIRL